MKTSKRIHRWVPAVAVAGVTLAALGASWLAPSAPASQLVSSHAERPSLDAPVRVVKAPPL